MLDAQLADGLAELLAQHIAQRVGIGEAAGDGNLGEGLARRADEVMRGLQSPTPDARGNAAQA